jgi:hypothetical protein
MDTHVASMRDSYRQQPRTWACSTPGLPTANSTPAVADRMLARAKTAVSL